MGGREKELIKARSGCWKKNLRESPRHPGRVKGVGGAFARPQGPAARSRSREQAASLFAHVPRSLAPPATSPRCTPPLRFVPADPVARVAQKKKAARPPASLDVLLASGNRSLVREAAEAILSLFYNDMSGSKGAAGDLHERNLRGAAGAPTRERQGAHSRPPLRPAFAAATTVLTCVDVRLSLPTKLPVTRRDYLLRGRPTYR